jgi:hypothetical protein
VLKETIDEEEVNRDSRQADEVDESVRKTIALYNADDCFSTRSLRDWLERERQALEEAGHRISRPPTTDGAPPEAINERQRRTAALAERLKRGVSADPGLRNDEDAARWLLAISSTGIAGNPRRIGGSISV